MLTFTGSALSVLVTEIIGGVCPNGVKLLNVVMLPELTMLFTVSTLDAGHVSHALLVVLYLCILIVLSVIPATSLSV